MTDPDAVRQAAREVLADDRFQRSEAPRPLREPLRELGEVLQRPFEWLGDWVPGGSATAWAIAGGLVLVAAALLAARQAQRQVTRAGRGRAGTSPAARPSAAEIRRRALDAEREGDLGRALRLHYRAGLVELDEAGVIELRPGRPNGELLRTTGSPTLDLLTARFEHVVYGGDAVQRDDLDDARRLWPRVREEAVAP